MNNNDRINLIRRITEIEGLTDHERSALLGLLRENKTYGLVWENKKEYVEDKMQEKLPVLKEVPKRAIISDSKDAPNHILIEGDNLEALTTLAYTHAGQIDVIYIDPPYNRGEKDFKYNDNYIDKENPFKHSMWLSFMSKRLKLAKLLLSNEGVMIIHIDEHEYDALNLLLGTEIFSPRNCLGTIVWNKLNPKGDANAVAIQHEYIYVYCKDRDSFSTVNQTFLRAKPNAVNIINKAKSLFAKLGKTVIPEEVRSVIKPFNYPAKILKDFHVTYDIELINKEFQAWLSKSNFNEGEKAYKYIDENGDVFQTVSMAWPNKKTPGDEYFIPLKHPINGKDCPVPEKGWRYPPSTFKEMLGTAPAIELLPGMVVKGQIVFTTGNNGNNQPRSKYLLKDNMYENLPSIVNDGSSNDKLFKELGISFEYPKTLSIARYLLRNILPNAKYILDFFAGSGTTLHATMQLNAEDGGHRQCILVTNNENDICEKVTYERNKRVIQGYTTPKGEQVAGLTSNTLRYYKTHFVPREPNNTNKRELVAAATELLCIKNDVYQEQSVFCGRRLKPTAARYFDDGRTQMLIIYNELTVKAFVKAIGGMEVGGRIKVYVFSNNSYAYADDFEAVADKVEVCALPAAIYDAYKKVLPPRKRSGKPADNEPFARMRQNEEKQAEFNFKEKGGEA